MFKYFSTSLTITILKKTYVYFILNLSLLMKDALSAWVPENKQEAYYLAYTFLKLTKIDKDEPPVKRVDLYTKV